MFQEAFCFVRAGNTSVLLLVLATLSTSTQAATITFDSPTTISGPSDISSSGTLVNAFYFNLDDPNSTALSINGITVTNFFAQNVDTISTIGESVNGYDGFGNDGFNNDYGTLLENASFTYYNPETITLNGLNAGDNYTVEFLASDARSCCGTVEEVDGDPGGVEGTVAFGNHDSLPVGQFVTGSFTADAGGSQTLFFTDSLSDGGGQVNGLVLSDTTPTPEPGTASTLLLAGCLAVAARFRFRN